MILPKYISKGKIRTKLNKNLKQNFTAELMNHYAHHFGKIRKVERSLCYGLYQFFGLKKSLQMSHLPSSHYNQNASLG